MARRRQKRRTHLITKPEPVTVSGQTTVSSASRTPKSMVIRAGAGEIGSSVSQLVKDFRHMMEPHTASRLRERRSNRLRDYTTMAGPLGVSHLVLFSRSERGNVNLRLALTPRGPTMHFRVERYSLCKDIKRAMKRPTGTSNLFTAPPLLVMNNFVSLKNDQTSRNVPKHLESLCTSVFQSIFPTISPATASLASIQRVLLLDRDVTETSQETDSYTLNLRHYAIRTRPVGLPNAIRRINAAEKVLTNHSRLKKSLPNLGKLNDISDYLLDPSNVEGLTSGGESEPETDAEIEMMSAQAHKVSSRTKADSLRQSEGSRTRIEKRAVRLSEIGPRLRLRLLKVEEGVCTGKVLWHGVIKKTEEEEEEQDRAWEEITRKREERKRQQNQNIARKNQTNASRNLVKDDENVTDEDMMSEDDWDSEDSDDSDGLFDSFVSTADVANIKEDAKVASAVR